ncbi:MAG: hypothetical protein ACFCUR_06500 [Rhodomicrobiaceae bacterium]
MIKLAWFAMTAAMFGVLVTAAVNTVSPASAVDQKPQAAAELRPDNKPAPAAPKAASPVSRTPAPALALASAQPAPSAAVPAKHAASAPAEPELRLAANTEPAVEEKPAAQAEEKKATAAAEKTTHLFAIGVCPPWKKADNDEELTKKWAASCRNDVNVITDALRKAMTIGDANTTRLIDADATYEAVISGMRKLAQDARREDRVVIYLNTHGGEFDAIYRGYVTKDEVFAFYSESEPTNFQQATINGPWMTARAFRDLVDGIKAEEIVLIVESCHSAASYDDFRYDLGGRYRDGWKGREAIIYSAGGDQIANFVEDNDKALFTSTFADVLASQQHKTLGDAFQAARIDTHRDIRKRCLTGPYADQMQLNHEAYLTYCTQEPAAFDPYGLLDDIELEKRTESAMLSD